MTLTPILRSRARLVAALLLPALVFRALIPAGFMPMIGADGRLGIELCTGVVAAPRGALDPHAHHHAHNAGALLDHAGHAGHGQGHGEQICPFALAAAAPLAGFAAAVAADAGPHAPPAVSNYRVLFIPPIERSQEARAPPVPQFI